MDWGELRAAVRNTVHSVFARSATYQSPSYPAGHPPTFAMQQGTMAVNPVDITVRLHTNIEVFGDLDREGYAQQAEDVNRMVFLSADITPARGGIVTMEDGSVYQIRHVLPADGPAEIACLVARVRTP